MKNNKSFLIVAFITTFILILNIALYYPFAIYNLSLNVVNWEKESRVFYGLLAGSINLTLILMSPMTFDELKNKEK